MCVDTERDDFVHYLSYTNFMYIPLDIRSNNLLIYNNLRENIKIWDFYVQLVLSSVTLCYYYFVYFTKLVLNQGPMEDHLLVNGLPCINR